MLLGNTLEFHNFLETLMSARSKAVEMEEILHYTVKILYGRIHNFNGEISSVFIAKITYLNINALRIIFCRQCQVFIVLGFILQCK